MKGKLEDGGDDLWTDTVSVTTFTWINLEKRRRRDEGKGGVDTKGSGEQPDEEGDWVRNTPYKIPKLNPQQQPPPQRIIGRGGESKLRQRVGPTGRLEVGR